MNNKAKKTVALIAAVILILSFCSCSISFTKTPKMPPLNFTANADIKYKTFDGMSCKITNVENGPLTLDITKPEILTGLSIVCVDNSCTIKYGSLSYEADTQKYPQLAFANTLNKAIDGAKDNAQFQKNDDSTWLVHTVVDSSDVLITLDGETSYPLSIKIPDEEFEMTFSNFTETEKEKS